jgi:hypothetical protein
MKKRTKLTPLPSLIEKADRITSQYIRRKFADHAGNVTCITCGKVLHWKEAHCAHFIGRSAKATRWLEENLHPACCGCNTYRKEFHMREYTVYMVDMYGRAFVDELREMERKVLSASQVRDLANEAIEEFSNGLRYLEVA